MGALGGADFVVLAGFFVVLLGVGFFYANRMQDLRDFFSGGRQVPWWLAGISLYMTTFSAFTFVSYSALAYQHGFVAVTIWWFSIPGCLISAWWLAARWRKAATTSPVEYLETRFSPALRQCFGWFGIPLIVLDDALKLFVIGTLSAATLGFSGDLDLLGAIAICGVIMLSYTLLGGLWAVLITDFVQFIVMAFCVLVLVPLAWNKAGGFEAIQLHLPAEFWRATGGSFTWPWLLSFSVVLALTFAAKWPYVQRYYAARSDSEARRVGYLVAALTLVSPPLLFFPAVAARVFLPEVQDVNQVYAQLCGVLLPAGMLGLMLAAMFSATMSMLSSDYNALASVITNDILKRLLMPNASDRALVYTARLVTLGVGLSATALAMLFAQAEKLEMLVQYMAQLFAALLPPVALPMVAGLVSRRASNGGALLGFGLGAGCGAAAFYLSYTGYPELRTVPYMTWITLLPTAVGLLLGSWLFPIPGGKREQVAAFLNGMRRAPQVQVGLVESGDAAVAARVIGWTVALLGLIMVFGVLLTAGVSAGGLSVGVGAAMAALGAVMLLCGAILKPKAQPAASRAASSQGENS